jgi:hypothetical protein
MYYKLFLFVLACIYTGFASADTFTLDVTADIDGRDDLVIQGNTLTWQHFDYQPVGLSNPSYPSTILTTTFNGVTQLNNYAWTPSWPNGTSYGSYTSTFSGLGAPFQLTNASLVVEQARQSITLLQQGTLANNYKTIIEFNDNAPGGNAIYQANLTFTSAVPEAGEWAMMLLGLPLLGWVVRRKQSEMQIA